MRSPAHVNGIVVKGRHPLVICDDRRSALTQSQASSSRRSGRHTVKYRHRVHVVWRKSPGDDSHLFGNIVLAQPLRKVGNATWFPRDIEDALCEITGVLQASVVGLPDEKLGTRPVGCVTIAPDTNFNEAAAQIPLRATLPQYDLSSLTIKVVTEFPMTPTGKISKAQLAAQLSAARE